MGPLALTWSKFLVLEAIIIRKKQSQKGLDTLSLSLSLEFVCWRAAHVMFFLVFWLFTLQEVGKIKRNVFWLQNCKAPDAFLTWLQTGQWEGCLACFEKDVFRPSPEKDLRFSSESKAFYIQIIHYTAVNTTPSRASHGSSHVLLVCFLHLARRILGLHFFFFLVVKIEVLKMNIQK